MLTRHDRMAPGRSLAVILVIVVIVAVLVSLAFVSLSRVRARARQTGCAENLARIYEALHVYRTRFGGETAYPPHTGPAFLTCLAGDRDPVHPASYSGEAPLAGSPQSLLCPARRGRDRKTDYRGPQLYVPFGGPSPHPSALGSSTPPRHPVACDRAGNHATKAGNVLRFDGTVSFEAGDAFEEAVNATE